MSGTCGRAAYVFRVQFRVRPSRPEVGVEPDRFETVATLDAAPPGESGWLFFRDHLWRGELNDESGVRDLLESALGTTVESVSFSELQTDEAYLEAFRSAIAEELSLFNADSVEEALSKYLGSSLHVRSV